ncbi:glutamate racemase [Pseudoalteromonas luteoviolacea]|nr:glutamate racemase [Pseudoalteromonas luteoviolacea]MBQ4878120.1 glutamate racemase [Pseudoalteromonas luteoviolacea]MBQ4907275.1 glutamate racemase [Pseudoalteromonas luteoviolacea]
MPHILVFDSGIGGTSVLSHLKKRIPYARYSYVMDNALLPYGLQSQETIKSRLISLLAWLDNTNQSVDVIVIACNTASTYALDTARQYTTTPIVGVVPAIKPAAISSVRKHIGLLATPATSKNAYTANLISNFASDCQVDIYHTTELVSIAEHFHWHKCIKQDQLRSELDRLNINPGIDKLVLGCTHFPIIKNALKAKLHTDVDLIDSGYAIAKRVEYLLTQHDCTYSGKNMSEVREELLASNQNDLTHWYATCTAAIKHCMSVELLKL